MEANAARGVVLRPSERNSFRMGDIDVAVLGSSEVTGGQLSLMETSENTPGGGPPLHIHRNAAESFYVLAGAYSMHLDGEDFECPVGSFIYVPSGMAHTFHSLEPNSRKLNLFTPAAMEGYFAELAGAIRSGVDDAGMTEIAERYEMDVLDRAPSGYLEATD